MGGERPAPLPQHCGQAARSLTRRCGREAGLQPVRELLEDGVNVSMGSDGTCSTMTANMLTVIGSADPHRQVQRFTLLDYCAGAGIGRMLDTRQPAGVVTSTMFIRNLVGCAGCPAAPMVNRIGT